jgi:hypothetical protein
VQHTRRDAISRHVENEEVQQAIIDEDPVADVDVLGERLVRHRDVSRPLRSLGDEHDVGALGEGHRGGQVADPDPRSLEIGENRHRSLQLVGQPSHDRDRLGVLLVRPVGEVDPGYVEPFLHESGDGRIGRGRRTERADDLRSRVAGWRHGSGG